MTSLPLERPPAVPPGEVTGREQWPRVLVVEDDDSHVLALTIGLEREGLAVTAVHDGRQVLGAVERVQPDVILLDVMLPGASGIEVCRDLRSRGVSTPIIMVSARSEELDVVVGIEVGADDYVAKPYRMRELVARIGALLRRHRPAESPGEPARAEPSGAVGWAGRPTGQPAGGAGGAGGAAALLAAGSGVGSGGGSGGGAPGVALAGQAPAHGPVPGSELATTGADADGRPGSHTLHVADVRLDPDRHEVRVRGEVVELPLREFQLLRELLHNAGRVVSRELLLHRVWGLDFEGDPRIVATSIGRLRARIEEDPDEPTRIVTIRGVGYRYNDRT